MAARPAIGMGGCWCQHNPKHMHALCFPPLREKPRKRKSGNDIEPIIKFRWQSTAVCLPRTAEIAPCEKKA